MSGTISTSMSVSWTLSHQQSQNVVGEGTTSFAEEVVSNPVEGGDVASGKKTDPNSAGWLGTTTGGALWMTQEVGGSGASTNQTAVAAASASASRTEELSLTQDVVSINNMIKRGQGFSKSDIEAMLIQAMYGIGGTLPTTFKIPVATGVHRHETLLTTAVTQMSASASSHRS